MTNLGGHVHSALAAASEAMLTPWIDHVSAGAAQAETDRRAAQADRDRRTAADAERHRADAQRRAEAIAAEDAKHQEQRRKEAAKQQRCALHAALPHSCYTHLPVFDQSYAPLAIDSHRSRDVISFEMQVAN